MEVDVERGTPEADQEDHAEEAREEDSHTIIGQLERGLPAWPGFEDVGWNESIGQVKVFTNSLDAFSLSY
jgi:hypothetical protein